MEDLLELWKEAKEKMEDILPSSAKMFLERLEIKDIKDNTIEYRLKLNNVPNSKYYFTTIKVFKK